MAHDHSHHHHHGHGTHEHQNHFNTAFKLGILLNIGYVIVEVILGYSLNSIALISDGIHNLSDVFGLAFSWVAFGLAGMKPTKNFTYGFGRSTILAAFFNALILLVAVGAIGIEAYHRIGNPHEVPGLKVSIISGIGILVNGISAWLFYKDSHDLNMKSNYVHLAADALISLGVCVTGIIIYFTNWYWMDVVVSFAVLIIIIYSTWKLMYESLRYLLDSVPSNINIDEVKETLLATNGVKGLHDLHVWNLTGSQTALTVHIAIEDEKDTTDMLNLLNETINQKFKIIHSTIQLEYTGHQEEHCKEMH
ncbi:MAG: cation diffusion facilitator family transporter [Bacteroidetes bacterium]|nr:cation diffusion facilitator family transporter [Bacteroidota bacterium]